ncbi:hypothetical protein, partial [Pseudoxanthomonas mexicana]|uniref:hypothetical protein n=1 Tax=Pseudoxanthomonas mexicana TaxID=128785 RepID=UPI0028AAB4B9
GLSHARVGHRQGLYPETPVPQGRGFFIARLSPTIGVHLTGAKHEADFVGLGHHAGGIGKR